MTPPARRVSAIHSDLDAAGIERAVVLSVGYSFADERKKLDDPDRLTREQNDWTSAEVARNGADLPAGVLPVPARIDRINESTAVREALLLHAEHVDEEAEALVGLRREQLRMPDPGEVVDRLG